MNVYTVTADLVIGLHLLYIGIVIFGQLAVMVGWPLGWNWIRNPWFRVLHLTMIVIVAVEAAVECECPLTTLEYWLRAQGGQLDGEVRVSFIGRYMQQILFHQGITDILTWSYYGFALLVLTTWLLVPPRYRRRQPTPTLDEPAPSTGITAKPM